MANTKNIIDMEGLYRAGYQSRIDAENVDKDRRVDLIDQLFMKAGQWVVGRYQQNHAELKGLKTLGRASNSQLQMEIEKLGGQLTPKMQESLDIFKAEYDKGARMSVKGLTRKKRQEGQLMMDMAFHKMSTMKKGLQVVQEQMQKQVDNGMIELGEKPFNGTAVTGWNAGASEEEFTNGVRLANGSMLENLSIDDETGEIYYMSQAMADVSEEAYNEYRGEMGGTQGTYEDYVTQMQSERRDNEIIGEDEWNKQNEGILSHEEWAELNENNPQIEATLFSRVKFPGEQDNSLQDGYMDLITTHEKAGLDGFEIDEESSEKLKMELHDRFSSANEGSIRSFLFGGQVTMVNDDGKLVRVTPAHKLLVDSGFSPGKADGTAEEQKAYNIFQAKLEEMKGEDFSKGSPRRIELVDMVTESIEGYQNNSYQKYLAKEEKAAAIKNKGGKGGEENYGTWPDGGTERRYINKQWMYPNDFAREIQPTIDALNSTNKDIGEINTLNGTAIKKEDGTWYWWNKTGGDGSGAWVKTDRNYIARGNNVLKYLDDIEEITGGNNLELSPTQHNTINHLSVNKDGFGYYPSADGDVKYTDNTYAIVPAIEGKNKGKMVAVTREEYGRLVKLHVKNKEYMKQVVQGRKDFANFSFNLKGAKKGDKRALRNLGLIEE